MNYLARVSLQKKHFWKGNTREDSPLRKIVREISVKNIDRIARCSKVLEIGCGYKNDIKRLVEGKGYIWFGLDVNNNSIATHTGSVCYIPFEDSFFDAVISSQSIEHWYEHATMFEEGIFEIYRVLKPGGLLMVDYPIYLHGHPIFMLGKTKKIHSLFDENIWEIIDIQSYFPSEPYYTWSGKRIKVADQFVMELILKFKNKAAYIEQIIARKKAVSDKAINQTKNVEWFYKKALYFLLIMAKRPMDKFVSFSVNWKE